MPVARFRSRISVPVEDLFAWHSRPGAFERLTPPWQRVDIVRKSGTIHNGDVLEMDFRLGPFSKRWIALHSDYVENRQFRDTQVQGPFRVWIHTHRVHADGADASILDDELRYELPLGGVIHPVFGKVIHRELTRLFRYRHARTRLDLWRHRQYRHAPRLCVGIAGGHPLAGQVAAFLTGGGHSVVSESDADAVVDFTGLELQAADQAHSLDGIVIRPRHGGVGTAPDGERARSISIDVPNDVSGPSFRTRSPLLLLAEALRHGMFRASMDRWISEDDLIGLIYHALLTPDIKGQIIADAGQPGFQHGFEVVFPEQKQPGQLITGRL